MFARLLCSIVLLVQMVPANAAPAGGDDNPAMVVDYSSFGDAQAFSFPAAMLDDPQTVVWSPADAVAIDDAPHRLVDACTAVADCRMAMMMPVPEPAALVLLLAGLLTIGAGRFAAPRTLLFR